MKTEKIVWGLILVFIGGVLLLENFGIIDFYWDAIWHFWPVILILVGVNMLFSRAQSTAITIAGVVITLAVLAFIGYQGTHYRNNSKPWFNFKSDNNRNDNDDSFDNDDADTKAWHNTAFSEPFVGNTKRAELNLSGGATVYNLADTTTNLIVVDTRTRDSGYSLQKITSDSMQIINFGLKKGKHNFEFNDMDENAVKIKLNAQPLWNINVKMGAGKTDLNLIPFKVKNLNLKGGAASFEAKLGLPESQTNVSVETGVAEVKLAVPKAAGCRITVSSGMSSKDFNGFDKQDDGTYTTSNFNTSSKKIIINLKGGLSDFEVSRY